MSTPPQDLQAAAGVLARAFFADPLFSWVTPDPGHRTRVLPGLFAGTLRYCTRRGGVLAEDVGVAGWLPMASVHMGVSDIARAGLPVTALRLRPAALRRLLAHEAACERRLSELAPAGAGYLWVVGVAPGHSGQGHGGRLVRRVLQQQAAAGHQDVLLKTEQHTNIGLYQHLGFRLVDLLPAPGGGPPSWFMHRGPAASARV